jgi:8-oxo-dGTP pyrophosphatase MutT (NUDIX family)
MYQIKTLSTAPGAASDWESVGADSNTIGTMFTATGTNAGGTGTVYETGSVLAPISLIYSPYNVDQVQNCINEMSFQEKERLMFEPFDVLWKMMWGETSGMQYRNEESASAKKFETIKNGVLVNNDLITLMDLIKNSKTTWTETEWEFPKGRRNYQEKDLECALREFEEETGYSQKDITIIENVLPFEEIFIGSNHKSYKHKYFLAYMSDTIDNLQDYQKTEVSKLEWKTIEECLASIRPYNLEKIKLIKNVSEILQDYGLYF